MSNAYVYDAIRTPRGRGKQNGSLHTVKPISLMVGLIEDAPARLAAAHTVRLAREAIAVVCDGAGASVYFETFPLQRLQRDVEVLKGHVVFDWDRTTELVGRLELGFEPRPTDML